MLTGTFWGASWTTGGSGSPIGVGTNHAALAWTPVLEMSMTRPSGSSVPCTGGKRI